MTSPHPHCLCYGRYMIADKLPSVNYLTFLDLYSYFSFLFLFIVVGENWLTKVSTSARDEEEWIVMALLVTWGTVCIIFTLVGLNISKQGDNFVLKIQPPRDVVWLGPLEEDESKWSDQDLTAALEAELAREDLTMVRHALWTGSAAHDFTKKQGIPTYNGKTRFIVAEFESEEAASNAVDHLDKEIVTWAQERKCNYKWGSDVKRQLNAEILTLPEWRSLVEPF